MIAIGQMVLDTNYLRIYIKMQSRVHMSFTICAQKQKLKHQKMITCQKKVFDIPEDMFPLIRKSWENKQLDLLSRYDFILEKNGQLYFLEVNGDTPSCIIEAGPAQKLWVEQFQLLQFNNIDNEIKQGLQKIIEKNGKSKFYMFNNSSHEDECTFNYLKTLIKPFLTNNYISTQNISKIDNVIDIRNQTQITLNLASLGPLRNYGMGIPQVSKQKYGREGDSIIFSKSSDEFGTFQTQSYQQFSSKPIFQEFIDSHDHQQRYITLNCWVIQGKPCGIVIREDLNPIIGIGSSAVPYYIQRDTKNEWPIQIDLNTDTEKSNITQAPYGNEVFNSNTDLIRIEEKITQKTQYIDPLFQDNLIRQNNYSQELMERISRQYVDYKSGGYQSYSSGGGCQGFSNNNQQTTAHRSAGSIGQKISSFS
ncbi:hypothetical protein ABPG72_014386 [Tetrahymena utriculariae]